MRTTAPTHSGGLSANVFIGEAITVDTTNGITTCRAVVDAVLRADVAHVVYGSVGGAEGHSGVPHLDFKARIKAHIAALGLPATILRPAFHSQLPVPGLRPRGEQLILSLGVTDDIPLQVFDADDIDLFAADAFDDTSTSIGRQLESASDELPGPQMAEVLKVTSGTPTTFHTVPIDQLRQVAGEKMASTFARFMREDTEVPAGPTTPPETVSSNNDLGALDV